MSRVSSVIIACTAATALVVACGPPNVVTSNGGPSASGSSGDASGATGGSSSSASGGTSSIITGDGGEAPIDMDHCATDTQRVALVPLDMGLSVDTSYSMDFDDKWLQVRDALNVFAKNPNYANMGVALQFFPIRQQCNVDLYGQPIVPMAVLPGVQPALTDAVDAQRMFGGTPLVQVMQGMVGYLRTWSKDHLDRKPVLVLATDGIPDDTCSASDIDPSNSLPNALALAKDAYEGSPSIPVFVIGVGEELSALNAIAEAGGTKSAAVIATTGNVTEQFLAALDGVRKSALACEYEIPTPTTGEIDYDAVNVTFSESSSGSDTFFYVPSAADCSLSAKSGWYYDDPRSPKHVVLCPDTCGRVSASADGRMDVAFGCKRHDVVR